MIKLAVVSFFIASPAFAQSPTPVPKATKPATKVAPAKSPAPTPAGTPSKLLSNGPAATSAPKGPPTLPGPAMPTYVSPSKVGANKDLYDVPKVTAVANKRFYLRDEITLQLTFLATDPYEKYLAPSGSYTHAFDNFWGWEVVNGGYAFAFDSGLKTQLIQGYNVNPDLVDSLQGYGTTNITMSPLYTKNLLFNSSTVYSQVAFVAGGGIAFFTYGGFQPIFDLGVILRYYLGHNSSLKFDFRDYVSPNGYTNNNVAITVGFAFDLSSK